MQRGPYQIISSKDVYKNPWIRVHEDIVKRPNGDDGLFGVVEYSRGISIAAINEHQEIYLIKEYAYAIGEYNLSLPQGGIDPNESPLDAAKRELKEEAGVEASEWQELGYINPYTMIINGPISLFLAKNARVVAKPESGLELITIPLSTAVQWVMESKINHSGSCITILKAKDYLQI